MAYDISNIAGKIKNAAFNKAAATMPRLTTNGREAARAVLVNGETQFAIAERLGITRQQVHRWCKKIFEVYVAQAGVPSGDLPAGYEIADMTVLLPADQMAQVREWVYQARLVVEAMPRHSS